MKRTSCLSALLVSLSLTTVSAAAEPATGAMPVKQVAQNDPANPPSSGGTSPSGAPASGDGTGTQPAVSLGTSTATPAKDTPAEPAPEPEKKPKPRPFAGSSIYNQNSMSTGTVLRGQTLDYNPTVESSLWMMPRYRINESFQLRARMIMTYELTNNDNTTYRNEPTLSDTTLNLYYDKLPALPGGFKPKVSVDLGLPTSKLSRSRTLVVSPGARLQVARVVEDFLGGDLMFLGMLIYSHPIYQSRNPEVVDPRPPGAFTCFGGNGCSDLLSGTMNPSDSLAYFALLSQTWGKWSPAIYYLGASQWVYEPTEAINPVDGTTVGHPAGFEPTSVKQTHYLSLWLDYNFNSWLTGEVGVWNRTSAITGAGNYANPLFNKYGDTRVYFGASIQIDNLVKELQGGDEGNAGIVRAKNNKQPMWRF